MRSTLSALKPRYKELKLERDGEEIVVLIRPAPSVALIEHGCTPPMLNMMYGAAPSANGEGQERGFPLDGPDMARLLHASVLYGLACPVAYDEQQTDIVPLKCRLGHEACVVKLDDLGELQAPIGWAVLAMSGYTARTVAVARFPGREGTGDAAVGDEQGAGDASVDAADGSAGR